MSGQLQTRKQLRRGEFSSCRMTFSCPILSRAQMCTGYATFYTTGLMNTASRFLPLSNAPWARTVEFLSGESSHLIKYLNYDADNVHSDQVMNTTMGSPDLPRAPEPLPANWGYFARYSHQRDLAMMSTLNGIERKPSEFEELVKRAGLRINKVYDCRSQVGLIEVVIPAADMV